MFRAACLSLLAVSQTLAFAPVRRVASSRRSMLRMLSVGDEVPMDGSFMVIKDGEPSEVPYADVFKGKNVVVCGVPGAFTGTCSEKSLPNYLAKVDDFKAAGADSVVCICVNDPFVVDAWSKAKEVGDKMTVLGDGGAAFVSKCDIGFDTAGFGGTRMRRLSMYVQDGKVSQLNLEEGGTYTAEGEGSNPEFLLASMSA